MLSKALFLVLCSISSALRLPVNGVAFSAEEIHDNYQKTLFSAGPRFLKTLATLNADDVYGAEHRNLMRRGCGEVCNTNITGTPGKYFDFVSKQVDCRGLFENEDSDAPAKMWPPPEAPPAALLQDFTMDSTLPIHNYYFQQRYSGNENGDLPSYSAAPVWSKAEIENAIKAASQNRLEGTYGHKTIIRVRNYLQQHKHKIAGKHFAVIGSEQPWLEALLLEAGAGHVTTIEYSKINSDHPRITTMLPSEVRKKWLETNGAEPSFDAIATFSSIEHSGLGRYGDIVNPWGDLQAVAKAWCMTKSGGNMFIGVPSVGSKGRGNGVQMYHKAREPAVESVAWNAHRIYGPKRWAQLVANWQQVDKEPENVHAGAGTMHLVSKVD